jgi:hypothetical protein
MRLVVIILGTLLFGSFVGVGSSYYQYGPRQDVYRYAKPMAAGEGTASGPAPAVDPKLRPRVFVEDGTTFDFGVMARNERRSHVFRVRNQGTADLSLAFIDKSCQCTDVTLSRLTVPPGEISEITLTWQPSSFNPEFQQTARFTTNDPSRIELDLTVKGLVAEMVQVSPRGLTFGEITLGQAREQTFTVSYREAGVEVSRVEITDPATGEHLRVEPGPRVDTSDQPGYVAEQPVVVRVLDTMPMGDFSQTLRVHLSEERLGTIDLPIAGRVAGNISLLGAGYNAKTGIWELGTLSGKEVQERKLWVFVKGEQASEVEMKIRAVDPDDVLEAQIQAFPSPTGSPLARHQLTLRIRPTGAVVNRLGYQQGELASVTLETTHPDVPELTIPVAFAVESTLP